VFAYNSFSVVGEKRKYTGKMIAEKLEVMRDVNKKERSKTKMSQT
jgi:hypothetical protein